MSNYEKKSALAAAFTPAERILTGPDAINPDKSMLYHHFNLNGYEAIFLRDFSRYLGMQEAKALDSTGICRTGLLSPLAAGFSVKYIVSTSEEKNARLVSGMQNGVKIYEIDNPLSRAYFPRKLKFIDSEDIRAQLDYLKNTKLPPFQEALVISGIKPTDNYLAEGKVLSYGAVSDKVFVEAAVTSPSVMVISDIFYNGWRAAAGKNKLNVFRANKVFQAVYLPKGDYTGNNRIVFYFLPGSLILGLMITLLSIGALYVFLLLFFKKATDEMCEAVEPL
jgi:hypothetical protein